MNAPILIVMAMRGEAMPLIEKLNLKIQKPLFEPAPLITYKGELKNKTVYLLLNGVHKATQKDLIGTQSATLTTMLGIQKFKPSKIFNFGTCGALKAKGAQIGDLYLAVDKVWFHTRRIPLPGWEEMGVGGYPTDGIESLARKHNLKAGILSSTDSLDFPELDASVFKRLNADVADMEGAAIAWLAEMYGIPFYTIKGVTDLMDLHRKVGEQFEENFDLIAQKISAAAAGLLSDIA